jgi:hypothetical protein
VLFKAADVRRAHLGSNVESLRECGKKATLKLDGLFLRLILFNKIKISQKRVNVSVFSHDS